MNRELQERANPLRLNQNQTGKQLLKNPLLQKDIWRTQEDLGLKINEHKQQLTIHFTEIEPLWFQLLTKLYSNPKSFVR